MTRPTRAAAALAVVLSGGLLTACGGGSTPPPAVAHTTVWLCQPGAAHDPCLANEDVTEVDGTGARTLVRTTPASSPPYDCFFVYPTVSTEQGSNSDLAVQRAETAVAVAEASPFSHVCRVFAPMYRQRTLVSLLSGLGGDPSADTIAYESLRAGWLSFLNTQSKGRPFVLIGHSQGAAMLIRLIRQEIDPSAALRRRLVTAIILGGNVTVANGRLTGGSFTNVPLCSARRSYGCVIAYSTFPSEPPPAALFGIPGQGVSLQSDQHVTTGVHVACVNPAALGGAATPEALTPQFRTSTLSLSTPVTTRWVGFPGLYTASCQHAGQATWLQVNTLAAHVDGRPTVSEQLGADWGYHLDDVALALGNLVDDVAVQEREWSAAN